jgi:hypothetical protein
MSTKITAIMYLNITVVPLSANRGAKHADALCETRGDNTTENGVTDGLIATPEMISPVLLGGRRPFGTGVDGQKPSCFHGVMFVFLFFAVPGLQGGGETALFFVHQLVVEMNLGEAAAGGCAVDHIAKFMRSAEALAGGANRPATA